MVPEGLWSQRVVVLGCSLYSQSEARGVSTSLACRGRWCSWTLHTETSLQRRETPAGGSSSPNPEEDDSLSAREAESAWSCDRPSNRGMDSSEEGTDES